MKKNALSEGMLFSNGKNCSMNYMQITLFAL